MIQLMFEQSSIQVVSAPDGSRVIIARDPQSGIQVALPLDEAGASQVASALRGVEIAHVMPGRGLAP